MSVATATLQAFVRGSVIHLPPPELDEREPVVVKPPLTERPCLTTKSGVRLSQTHRRARLGGGSPPTCSVCANSGRSVHSVSREELSDDAACAWLTHLCEKCGRRLLRKTV